MYKRFSLQSLSLFVLTCLAVVSIQSAQASCRNLLFDPKEIQKSLSDKGEGWIILPRKSLLEEAEKKRLYVNLSKYTAGMSRPEFRFWTKEKLLQITDEASAIKIMDFIQKQISLAEKAEGEPFINYSALLRTESGLKFTEGHRHDVGWVTITHALLNLGSYVESEKFGQIQAVQDETLWITDASRVSDLKLPYRENLHGTPLTSGPRLILILNIFPKNRKIRLSPVSP
jgi:hypothetical protein